MQEKLFLSFIYHITRELSPADAIKLYPSVKDVIDDDRAMLESFRDSFVFFQKEHFNSEKAQLILQAFAIYIETTLVDVIDQLAIEFFIQGEESKSKVLKNILDLNKVSEKVLYDFLIISSYEEVQNSLKKLVFKINPAKENIVIQTARQCDLSFKKDIRKEFKENGFVRFQVNKTLLGGMLVYQNGVLSDSSWLGKIKALKDLSF